MSCSAPNCFVVKARSSAFEKLPAYGEREQRVSECVCVCEFPCATARKITVVSLERDKPGTEATESHEFNLNMLTKGGYHEPPILKRLKQLWKVSHHIIMKVQPISLGLMPEEPGQNLHSHFLRNNWDLVCVRDVVGRLNLQTRSSRLGKNLHLTHC